jgi:hypothetical protein
MEKMSLVASARGDFGIDAVALLRFRGIWNLSDFHSTRNGLGTSSPSATYVSVFPSEYHHEPVVIIDRKRFQVRRSFADYTHQEKWLTVQNCSLCIIENP